MKFKSFVESVAENPPGESENLASWGQRILDLCAERPIEYPKIFLKRFKKCKRNRKSTCPLIRSTANGPYA